MIILDASVLLAYDNVNDVHHHRATRIMQLLEEGKYGEPLITDYVFQEVVGVTFRKKGKERAIYIGNTLRNIAFMMPFDDHLLQLAWEFFVNTTTTLNFVDCTTVIAGIFTKTPFLATFDKEFSRIESIHIVE